MKLQTIGLPGVLADKMQFSPLAGVLPNLTVLEYQGRLFHAHGEIERASQLITSAEADRVGVLAVSLGGVLAPFAVQALPQSFDKGRLKIVIVDSPFGLPTLVNPLAKWLAIPGVRRVASLLAALAKSPVNDDMLPKDDMIEVPEGVNAASWKLHVRDRARQDLQGYYLSNLASPTSWMCKVGRVGGAQEKAVRELDGLDVTYVACVHPGNDVVRQMLAAECFKGACPSAEVVRVASPHAAFLQMQDRWQGVLGPLFS